MKKIKITLQNLLLIGLIVVGIVSCQNDFAPTGTDIIGDNHFETGIASYPVITYTKPISVMQTNTLQDNLLGHYSDPIFGAYTASVVSQMTPTAYNPTFGENVELDSVVLTIPYFVQTAQLDDEGYTTYTLDSIYGNSPIKLSVFQNNYFLRDFNPEGEFGEGEKYYSNRTTSQGSPINTMDLEGQLLYSDDEFLPSSDEIILTEIDETGEPFESAKLPPAIRVHLDNPNDTYWQDLIFNKEGEVELSNENNFLDYFRGLYIKAEALGPDGTMMLLNLGSTTANITLYYTSETDNGGEPTDNEDSTSEGTFVLNFTGNKVNFFDNNLTPIPDGDPVLGDETIYLKGGQGYMAVVNLFEGDDEGNSVFLDDFKSKNWLINEARLEFFVDQNVVQGAEEPDRVFIYDIEKEQALIDYFLDPTAGNIEELARIDHLHPLEREGDDNTGPGIKYKIEITEHIKNIFLRDSTNTKLGLYVTSNANAAVSIELQDQNATPSTAITGSVLSPRGTALHGNRSSEENKRIQLKIFYTEPDN